jgi:hypothetical protein
MPPTVASIHVTSIPGLVGFVILCFVLIECARMLMTVLRNDRLIGWAIGPLGVSTLFLSEPPIAFILLNALFPAAIAGLVLYIGLFTALPSPIVLPHRPLVEALVIAGGILLTSTGNFLDALRDLRYPLWGEARILRSLQYLRASWATIHFTAFGLSYLRDHFGSSPTELLKAF